MVFFDLPVREEREEVIAHVVGKCASVPGICHRLRRVIRQDVGQQRFRNAPRFVGRISASVFQDVGEAVYESGVGRRVAGEVRRLLVAQGKEDRL
jgi:hypothetical protein